MGWLYFYTDETDLNYESFRRTVALEPQNARVNFDVGSFLGSIGLYDQTIKYYLRAIELDPFSLQGLFERGGSIFLHRKI